MRRPLVAYLPQPQPASTAGLPCCSTPPDNMQLAERLQLLTPQPGSLLEADRTQHFAVLAPASAAVAVGSQKSGWAQLQQQPQDATAADSAAASTAGQASAVFAGSVVLPRVNMCFVAVQAPLQNAEQECSGSPGSSWVPVLGLHVWPPVSDAYWLCPSLSPWLCFLQQAWAVVQAMSDLAPQVLLRCQAGSSHKAGSGNRQSKWPLHQSQVVGPACSRERMQLWLIGQAAETECCAERSVSRFIGS
jgi:hypothetical protein